MSPSTIANAQGQELIEWLNPHYGYVLTGCEKIYARRTQYQQLEVFHSPAFGHMLRLDGALQCSEKDEFFYHEPLVHMPAFQHAAPRSALVIGGGDGGTAEELLKHPTIEEIVLVEIDAEVIDVAKTYFRAVNLGIFDGAEPRFKWQTQDGYSFLQNESRQYDLVILDLTDPGGASEKLYSVDFYKLCKRCMAPGAWLSLHIAAPWMQQQQVQKVIGNLRATFATVVPYTTYITMSGGAWLMAMCSNSPLLAPPNHQQRYQNLQGAPLQYYSPQIANACTVLPLYLERLLNK